MTALLRSPTARASIGLALGLIVGIGISHSTVHGLRAAAAAIEPVGSIWVNAIRMTVIPLVVSLLIATIAEEHDLAAVGRLGTRAVGVFVVLLSGVALIGFLAGPPLFALVHIDVASATSVRGSTAPPVGSPTLPTFGSWVSSLVPANPLDAAAGGAMLPLVVFAVLFGGALARLAPESRGAGAVFFRGVAEAMFVIVRWVLAAAPIGVFALAVTLAIRVGVGVAGAVGFYLLVHSALLIVCGLLLYLVVRVASGVPIPRFARAMAPAQVVAVTTRSSVAALPAMMDGAEQVLRLPAAVSGFVLPFGVSVFRLNQGVSWIVAALFVGQLYGVHLALSQLALLAVTSVAMSFSVPGIPSGALFMIAPFFMGVGLPAEGVGILIALDPIPDLFKTLLNVTGQVTATVLLARGPDTSLPPVIAPPAPLSTPAREPAHR
jgi:Na+/H+-dicarboxylate symporter